MGAARLLAVDLGAESGRAVLGAFDGERVKTSEVRRFPNRPVELGGTLFWDVLALQLEICNSIRAAGDLDAVGLDTWGVDFALLDRAGRMIGNPVHYRDRRTAGIVGELARRVPPSAIYGQTGVPLSPINTLCQLMAMVLADDPQLQLAERMVTLPALFGYWLTGMAVDEISQASTTQCFDPTKKDWAREMLEKLGISASLFGTVVPSGTHLGRAVRELDLKRVRVIAPATHDTASAVAAVPFAPGRRSAFISSGTWSLVGIEVDRPITSRPALDANLSNESGPAGRTYLLRNVMGLWLMQECRRRWLEAGWSPDYAELLDLAVDALPFSAVIDPDDESLLRRGDMPNLIRQLAMKSGRELAPSPGPIIRCILESLALKYRWALERLEEVTEAPIETVHIVGGGARNGLLCQMTANAANRPVIAGPVEASALGNLVIQAMVLGWISSIDQARQLIERSTELVHYEPRSPEVWEPPYAELLAFTAETRSA